MASSSSRMLTLLSLLQARRDWSGAALAERLEVSTRTVRRDVDRLRDLGYAITAVKGPDGGYRLAAGADLPPLLFDDEQAVAIAVALQTATASGVAIGEAAERALASIEQVLPSRLRHRMRAVDLGDPHALGAHDAAARSRADAVHPQVLEAVGAAVRERRRLRFDDVDRDPGGDGADAARPRAEVEPHGIVARGGRWYLVGWGVAEQRWQVHRLDRIRPVTPAGARFERRAIPTGSAAGLVAARAKGSTDADAWPCVGQVVLELPVADVARWLGDAEAEPIAPDRTRVRVGSWSWTGLIAWLLRFDAPFVVEHPPELAARARTLADRLSSAGPA